MRYQITEGNYSKMGVTKYANNVIFTFEGEKEDQCSIVLIDRKTMEETQIDVPDNYCLGSLRSIQVSGIETENILYYYKRNEKNYIDPYAEGIYGRENWNDVSRKEHQFRVYGRIPTSDFRWKEEGAPEVKKSEMIMYKLHVRGFSMGEEKKSESMGTFSAISRKLGYLKDLGITTVELMPVYEFEEMVIPPKREIPDYVKEKDESKSRELEKWEHEKHKVNYWGYGPGNYFAVKAAYAKNKKHPEEEFRALINKMHQMKMECVMEICFSKDTNQNLILDALRYWVREFHVDGFHLLGDNLPIMAIVQDSILSRTKLFYEDFSYEMMKNQKKYHHLYVYKEEYLFPVRKILNHINGDMQEFINQQKKQDSRVGFVNYVASNNGFTLADLFMYNDRHNECNGENNEDGCAWNFSCNYGVEGPTQKRFIKELRKRQWHNAIISLMMAQGVPLIWAGDEFMNSQMGNNNAYCQDNEIGWVNWKNRRTHKEAYEFVKTMIAFRKEHLLIAQEEPYKFHDYKANGYPDCSYHGQNAWITGIWPGCMNLGVMLCGDYAKENTSKEDIYVGYNFFNGVCTLALPQLGKNKRWYRMLDSAKNSDEKTAVLCENQKNITLEPQSISVLIGK